MLNIKTLMPQFSTKLLVFALSEENITLENHQTTSNIVTFFLNLILATKYIEKKRGRRPYDNLTLTSRALSCLILNQIFRLPTATKVEIYQSRAKAQF